MHIIALESLTIYLAGHRPTRQGETAGRTGCGAGKAAGGNGLAGGTDVHTGRHQVKLAVLKGGGGCATF